MKFILDVKKWRSGGESTDNACRTGEGDVSLENDEGFMCCIGQFTKQIYPDKKLDHGTPRGFLCNKYKRTQNKYPFAFYNAFGSCKNTEMSEQLMKVNDSELISTSSKITDIRKILKHNGHSLRVINFKP